MLLKLPERRRGGCRNLEKGELVPLLPWLLNCGLFGQSLPLDGPGIVSLMNNGSDERGGDLKNGI